MTEAEWLACEDPLPMLDLVRVRGASERKVRLFTLTCGRRYRRVWCDPADGPVIGGLVERLFAAGERHIDGAVCSEEIDALRLQLGRRPTEWFWSLDGTLQGDTAFWGRLCGDRGAGLREEAGIDVQELRQSQADLLRDLFGPAPFRPLPRLNPAWLAWEGGTVAKLAAAIYEERSFDRLPILADALEEAGCDAADLLTHLRGPGPHVRGCWAVDLLLGKG
jgi:hypothetical protein